MYSFSMFYMYTVVAHVHLPFVGRGGLRRRAVAQRGAAVRRERCHYRTGFSFIIVILIYIYI